jgi:enoyl-CoA hydratase/carnithine racemase
LNRDACFRTTGAVARCPRHPDRAVFALRLARAIAAKSKATVAIGKEAFYRQAELPLAEAYDFASEVMVKNMMTADAEEGICAFIEKRKPDWKDR